MDLLGFFYGFGFLHGVVLAGILLFTRYGYRVSNAFMAGLVTCIAVRILVAWLIRLGFFDTYPGLSFVSNPLEFAWGPLLYLYAYSMINRKVHRRQILHFLPFVLVFSEPLTLLSYTPDQQAMFLEYIWSERNDIALSREILQILPGFWQFFVKYHLHGILFSVQFACYCTLVLRLIHAHNLKLEDNFSYTEQMNLRWLRTLVILCIAFLALYLVFNRARIILVGHFDITEFGPNTPFLFLVLCIYVIGIAALRQPGILAGIAVAREAALLEAEPPTDTTDEKGGDDETETKYTRSRISLENAKRYKDRILRAMDEYRPYLDSELTLRELARQTGLSYHQASQVINGQMNQRFFSFINEYRIKLAMEMMAAPETSDMPIVELAVEVGFKSKSSFYDAFKKVTRMTPTQYKKSLGAVP